MQDKTPAFGLLPVVYIRKAAVNHYNHQNHSQISQLRIESKTIHGHEVGDGEVKPQNSNEGKLRTKREPNWSGPKRRSSPNRNIIIRIRNIFSSGPYNSGWPVMTTPSLRLENQNAAHLFFIS